MPHGCRLIPVSFLVERSFGVDVVRVRSRPEPGVSVFVIGRRRCSFSSGRGPCLLLSYSVGQRRFPCVWLVFLLICRRPFGVLHPCQPLTSVPGRHHSLVVLLASHSCFRLSGGLMTETHVVFAVNPRVDSLRYSEYWSVSAWQGRVVNSDVDCDVSLLVHRVP